MRAGQIFTSFGITWQQVSSARRTLWSTATKYPNTTQWPTWRGKRTWTPTCSETQIASCRSGGTKGMWRAGCRIVASLRVSSCSARYAMVHVWKVWCSAALCCATLCCVVWCAVRSVLCCAVLCCVVRCSVCAAPCCSVHAVLCGALSGFCCAALWHVLCPSSGTKPTAIVYGRSVPGRGAVWVITWFTGSSRWDLSCASFNDPLRDPRFSPQY